MKRIALIAFVALLYSYSTIAAEISPEDVEEFSSELMAQSGVPSLVQQVSASVLQGVYAYRENIDEDQFDRLWNLMRDIYDPDKIRQSIQKYIIESTYLDLVNHYQTWFSSPLGHEIREAEFNMGELAFQNIQNFAEILNTTPPEEARLSIIQELAQATSATDMSVDASLLANMGFVVGMNRILPGDQQASLEELRHNLNLTRTQIYTEHEQAVWLSLLYTYRNFDDDQLKEYLAYADTPKGRRLYRIVKNAVFESLEDNVEMVNQTLSLANQ